MGVGYLGAYGGVGVYGVFGRCGGGGCGVNEGYVVGLGEVKGGVANRPYWDQPERTNSPRRGGAQPLQGVSAEHLPTYFPPLPSPPGQTLRLRPRLPPQHHAGAGVPRLRHADRQG